MERENPEVNILESQKSECKILAKLKILKRQKPELNIFFDQNPDFKILADFKTLDNLNLKFWTFGVPKSCI